MSTELTLTCSVEWKLKKHSTVFPEAAELKLELSSGLTLDAYFFFRGGVVSPSTVGSSWMHLYPGNAWWTGPFYSDLSRLVSKMQNNPAFPDQALSYAIINGGISDPLEAHLVLQELTFRAQKMFETVREVFLAQASMGNLKNDSRQLRLWKSSIDGAALRLSGPLL